MDNKIPKKTGRKPIPKALKKTTLSITVSPEIKKALYSSIVSSKRSAFIQKCIRQEFQAMGIKL